MLLYLQKIIQSLQEIAAKLEERLRQSCDRCQSNMIALSGGLDSSILAYCLRERKPTTIAVVAKDFVGNDLVYCQLASKKLNLPLAIIKAGTSEILDAIENTISILGNFNDIEIRNNIVMYLAIKWAKDNGSDGMITGDGADELFAGYNFLLNKTEEDLKGELERISSIMHFPTQKIGDALGVRIEMPYLDEGIKEIVKKIPPNLLIRDEKGKKYGKWILRKTYEKKIPPEIAWRQKSPMQDGSGTNHLPNFFNSMIRDNEYEKKQEKIKNDFNISIRSKESMFYFEIFKTFHKIKQNEHDSKSCPYCHFKTDNSKFCRMCGAFPI